MADNPTDIKAETNLLHAITAMREQTRHADGKAQTLAGALVPSLVGAIAVGGFAGLPTAATVFAIPATAAALAAILVLGTIIWPQTGDHPQPLDTEATLAAARRCAADPNRRLTCLASEHSQLTRIAAVKWRRLAIAIVCTGAALALGAVTVAITALT